MWMTLIESIEKYDRHFLLPIEREKKKLSIIILDNWTTSGEKISTKCVSFFRSEICVQKFGHWKY